MTPAFPSRLPDVGTTIFTVMSALAAQYNAVNLGQGFPDFLCDESLMKLVDEFIRKGMNQYAPMPGIMSLRETIAEKYEQLHGAVYNPETEITITPGGTEALYATITALVHEGDEVIVFEPCYDSYLPVIELCKATAVHIELQAPDYKVNWEQVKKRITNRTRMIILNTPHNPTGTILSALDMVELEKLVKNTDIIILSDEVYEHIVFDNATHQSVMRYPLLRERSMVVYSFGKTYHNTGWKMGYCLAPEVLMKEFRKVHQFNVFSVNSVAQVAFAEILKRKELYLELNSFYQQKRDYFRKAIQSSRFNLLKCEGTYFQLVSYSKISDERDLEFVKRMTREIGVAAIPVSVFYRHHIDNSIIRFCFAKEEETLKRAAEKISKM